MILRLLFVLLCFVLCLPLPAHADAVLLESGLGFHTSHHSKVLFLRYHKDSDPLFWFDSYYALGLATWSGKRHNNAAIIAKGVRWKFLETMHFDFEGGGAYIQRTTRNLGTRLQFAWRCALGLQTEKFDFALGYNHLSNGKSVFHWSNAPNLGENFITLHLGYLF